MRTWRLSLAHILEVGVAKIGWIAIGVTSV